MGIRVGGILIVMRGCDEFLDAFRALESGSCMMRYTQESSCKVQRACLEVVRAHKLCTLIVFLLGSFKGVVLHLPSGVKKRSNSIEATYEHQSQLPRFKREACE